MVGRNYFLTLASVLEDVGWIEQESSGEYIITDKGNSEAKKYWYDNSKSNQILFADHSIVVCIVWHTCNLFKLISCSNRISDSSLGMHNSCRKWNEQISQRSIESWEVKHILFQKEISLPVPLRYQVYDLHLRFLWVSESIRDMNDGLANIKE